MESTHDRGELHVDNLLEVHRRVLFGGALAAYGGQLRTRQSWMGGSAYHPCTATFVPPPPEDVAPLLDDLVAFCNTDALAAVA